MYLNLFLLLASCTTNWGCFTLAKFNVEKKEFLSTPGGKWPVSENKWKAEIEFATQDASKVGHIVERNMAID